MAFSPSLAQYRKSACFLKADVCVEDADDSSRSVVLSVRIDGGFMVRNCGSRPDRTPQTLRIGDAGKREFL
jgi:hypothetical protein